MSWGWARFLGSEQHGLQVSMRGGGQPEGLAQSLGACSGRLMAGPSHPPWAVLSHLRTRLSQPMQNMLPPAQEGQPH